MRFPFPSRFFSRGADPDESLPSAPTDAVAQVFPALAPALKIAESIHPVAAAAIENWRNRAPDSADTSEPANSFLRTVAWVSAGVGAVALGLVVGREIRLRYKFNRRTPYDFYAHSGDERDLEFGVGI